MAYIKLVKKIYMNEEWLYGSQDSSIVGGGLEKETVQDLEVIMLIQMIRRRRLEGGKCLHPFGRDKRRWIRGTKIL